jgi:hypothetical protein
MKVLNQDYSEWIGKQIKWETPRYRLNNSGSGFTSTRTGLCLEYIAPGVDLWSQKERYGWNNSQLKAGNGHGSSVNPRLLVRVDRFGVKGQKLAPYYYCPRLSSVIGLVEEK